MVKVICSAALWLLLTAPALSLTTREIPPPAKCMVYTWQDEDTGRLFTCLTKFRSRRARRSHFVKRVSRSRAIPVSGGDSVREDIWQAIHDTAMEEWLKRQRSAPQKE